LITAITLNKNMKPNQKTTSEEWEKKLRDLWFRGRGQTGHFMNELIPFISTLILQKQKEVLKDVDEIITDKMFAIANEPLDKRQNGYDELLDIRGRINKVK